MIHLSIIIPVLNEARTVVKCLEKLQAMADFYPHYNIEIIVVDGGSVDNTLALAKPLADQVISAQKGRAKQMNSGAKNAAGNYLLFLHSDTDLPFSSDISTSKNRVSTFPFIHCDEKVQWGFYPISLSGKHVFFRVIETMINYRSRITSVATGDQCLFVERALFFKEAGYSNLPLMEDVELTKRLRKKYKPYIASSCAITDSRRWERRGIIKTVLLMWYLRGLYFLGVSPLSLVKKYY
ncbi:MAG: rSAM/selenodomain-associated transferase 2 [Candidatus Endobugula sp.]|jgi:rSAM/selenodomain-associated transferase 2